jgi:hypothetical protein
MVFLHRMRGHTTLVCLVKRNGVSTYATNGIKDCIVAAPCIQLVICSGVMLYQPYQPCSSVSQPGQVRQKGRRQVHRIPLNPENGKDQMGSIQQI